MKCAEEEQRSAAECKKLYPTPERVLKRACCASFAVEKCIIKHVDEDCKPFLNDRYQNSPLRKGDCKPFYDKCDEIISTSPLSTTHQPPPESYEKPKPENLKQSISQSISSIPQSPTQPENHNLIAEEQKNHGVLTAGSSVLLMVTCGSLVMVSRLLSRRFN